MRSRLRALAMLIVMPAACAGCGTDLEYYLHLAGGALQQYGVTRPIEDVLRDGSVTPEQAAKLQLVLDMRAYGANVIGLNAADAYSSYHDNSNELVGYALSASARDQFRSYVWQFPIVGPSDVKPYFDRDMALAEVQRLQNDGLDVFVGIIEGFSTLGLLADPIRTSNLDLDDAGLAEFLFHELLHNTIYKLNDTDFNESMATFIGRAAARRFFADTYGPDSPQVTAADERFADLGVIDEYVDRLYSTMVAYYAQPIPSEEKIAGREEQFALLRQAYLDEFEPRLHNPERYSHIRDLAQNNALILAGVRYQGDLDIYAQAFERLGEDFAAMLDLLRKAAQEPDSKGYLRDWLDAHPAN